MIHYTTTMMCRVKKEGDNEWAADEVHSHPLFVIITAFTEPTITTEMMRATMGRGNEECNNR
jgi:hypothetical protein